VAQKRTPSNNMAADLILSISARPGLALDPPQARTMRSAMADYWALTKPEVSFLIAIATFTGFYLAVPASVPDLPWLRLMNTYWVHCWSQAALVR